MEMGLNRSAFAVISLMVFLIPANAVDEKQSEESAVQFINKVRDRVDIRAEGGKPFRLRASFEAAPVAKGNSKTKGTYLLTWISPFQWREEIAFGGYSEVRVASQSGLHVVRSVPGGAVRAYQLRSLLNLWGRWKPGLDEVVRDMGEKERNGVAMHCVEVTYKKRSKRALCADAGALVPLREEARESREYADYVPFVGKQFPRVLRAYEDSKRVLDVRVEELTESPQVDTSIFVPPPMAVVWDWCSDEEPAVVIEKPKFRYPALALDFRQQGTVTVSGIVGVDGWLRQLVVIRSAGPVLDAAALAEVSRWRFKPATCRGTPIAVEQVMDFNYRLK